MSTMRKIRKADLVLDHVYVTEAGVPVRLLQKKNVINPLYPNSKVYVSIEPLDPETLTAIYTPLFAKSRELVMTWEKHLAIEYNMKQMEKAKEQVSKHLGVPLARISVRVEMTPNDGWRPIWVIYDNRYGHQAFINGKGARMYPKSGWGGFDFEDIHLVLPNVDIECDALMPIPNL